MESNHTAPIPMTKQGTPLPMDKDMYQKVMTELSAVFPFNTDDMSGKVRFVWGLDTMPLLQAFWYAVDSAGNDVKAYPELMHSFLYDKYVAEVRKVMDMVGAPEITAAIYSDLIKTIAKSFVGAWLSLCAEDAYG